MARTAVTASVFTGETVLADPAGTTIDSTLVSNGVNVALTSAAVPPANNAARGSILIRIANSDTSAHNLIIRKGANPPAFRADLGDSTIAIALSSTKWVGPLDISKFAQSDGSLNLDFSTGFTGTITVFSTPHKVS